MTSLPPNWDELHLAENPAIELLQHLGYTYVAPEVLETERASLKAPILTRRLAAALKQLNPWLSDDNIRKAVRVVTGVAAASLTEANEKLHTTLTYGIALEQDRGEGKKNYTVRFFDFATPHNNALLVTRQFKVVGAKKTIIADIVALVNGLPLAVIECKSPTIGDKWQSEAISQLLRYQESGDDYWGLGAPQLFETVQLVLATCGQAAVYGTVGTPARAFAEWKEPYPLTAAQLAEQLGRAPTAQDIALYGLLSPANLLDLTRNFVVFDAESGRTVRKDGFKAQIVAVNRDVAVTYKETLERLNAPTSALIMSTTHNDPERLARHALSREEQNRLIDRFKDPHDPLVLLVVCDMLLTGFDAPVEQVLYLDAPLKEHTLLQAIARVNRKADKKDYGLVVDYWGVSEALHDALEIFAPSDVTGAMTPTTDELPRLQTRHQAVLRFFTTVRDTQDLNACVALLEPEDVRAEFDVAFRRFSQSLDMLLPDPWALPYLPDLRWLGKIRQAARARYRDSGLDLTDCGAKVRKLIEDAVIAEGMQILVQEVSLFSKEFEDKLAAVHQPDAQASEMEHAMRYEIHVKLEDNPVFYQSLRERLEAIVELRKQQRIDAAEQLKLFQALVDEMRSLGSTAAQLGLSETSYALYGLLQADDGTLTAQEAAATYNTETKELAELVEREVLPRTAVVDWWQKDDLLRQMRRDIKRVLRGNVPEARLEALTAEMVDLIRRRRGQG